MKQEDQVDVSIICITYNHIRFIRRAIEGFLMQKTSFSYEIIIHDDVSTDGTREVLIEYQKKYPDKIRLILEEENQYSKGKRILYLCLPEVKGEYIAISEGDDEWTYAGKLQAQYDLMNRNPDISLCLHNAVRYNLQTGEKENQIRNISSKILDDEEIILEPQGRAPTTSFFFRTEYISGLPQCCYNAPVGDDPLRFYYACRGKVFYINKTWATRNFMHIGSWNYRMQNKDFELDYIKKYLCFLDEFNVYSKRRFGRLLQDRMYRLCFWAIELLQPEKMNKKELEKIIDLFEKETEKRFSYIVNRVYESMLSRCVDHLDREIEEFINKCKREKGKIFLYGTGETAKCFAEKLKYKNIPFEGFVVSDNYKTAAAFMEKKIWEITEIDQEKSYIWI